MVTLPELNISDNNVARVPPLPTQLVGTYNIERSPQVFPDHNTSGKTFMIPMHFPRGSGAPWVSLLLSRKTACIQREWRHSRAYSLADMVAGMGKKKLFPDLYLLNEIFVIDRMRSEKISVKKLNRSKDLKCWTGEWRCAKW